VIIPPFIINLLLLFILTGPVVAEVVCPVILEPDVMIKVPYDTDTRFIWLFVVPLNVILLPNVRLTSETVVFVALSKNSEELATTLD